MNGGLPERSDVPVLFHPVRGPQEPASSGVKLPPKVGVCPYVQTPFGLRVVEKSLNALKVIACAADPIPKVKVNVTPITTPHPANDLNRKIILLPPRFVTQRKADPAVSGLYYSRQDTSPRETYASAVPSQGTHTFQDDRATSEGQSPRSVNESRRNGENSLPYLA